MVLNDFPTSGDFPTPDLSFVNNTFIQLSSYGPISETPLYPAKTQYVLKT